MKKKVLDVGNCSPDHQAIVGMLRGWFDVDVLQADRWEDSRDCLSREAIDLILVNRKLDIDYSDGIEIILKLKQDPVARTIPVMLVSNYPEHQQQAVAVGAELGFGKLELRRAETRAKLERILGNRVSVGGS